MNKDMLIGMFGGIVGWKLGEWLWPMVFPLLGG